MHKDNYVHFLKSHKGYTQRLEPQNTSYSIEEGLKAKIKDPLFSIGRQWQAGEFTAKNGGSLVRTEVKYKMQELNIAGTDGVDKVKPFDLKEPIEYIIENELKQEVLNEESGVVEEVKSPLGAWKTNRLEYDFYLRSNEGGGKLVAKEYDGRGLDWYHFNQEEEIRFNEDAVVETHGMKPSKASFRGMPNARWWTFEDSRVNLGNIKKPYLNSSTALLIEFGLIFSNNWYLMTLSHPVGKIRKIEGLRTIDSFGVVQEVKPVVDETGDNSGWEIFTLSKVNAENSDGSVFYLPNNIQHHLKSDSLEDVNLVRDEQANLVWAIEDKYTDESQIIVRRGDEPFNPLVDLTGSYYYDIERENLINKNSIRELDEIGKKYIGPVEKLIPKSPVPTHWIPYVPRNEDRKDMYLRRGKTKTDEVQYRGGILKETKVLFEEEVPRTGVRVVKKMQLSWRADGLPYIWKGREKRIASRVKLLNLLFDSLEK